MEVNPLTPMSDHDRISPYIINTVSSIQVIRTRIKYSTQVKLKEIHDGYNKIYHNGYK